MTRKGQSPPRRASTLRIIAAPLVVGGLARLLAALLAPLAPQWDGAIYVRGAEQLAHGLGYTTAILQSDVPSPEPTAFFPIGFPALLASLRYLGLGLRADLLLQAALGTASIALVFALAHAVDGRRTAVIASWLFALSPGSILYTTTWLAEPAVGTGLLLALVTLAYARRATFYRALALFGLVMGFVSFLRVTTLVITPLVAFGLGYARFASRPVFARLRVASLAALVATTAALLPLAPWAARNAVALGEPVLVSTNGGLNLLLGTYGEGGYRRLDDAEDCPEGMKELEVDACRKARAIARIEADPFAWLARGVGKVWHTFGHESAPAQHLGAAIGAKGGDGARVSDIAIGITRLHWTLFLGLSIAGALVLFRRPFAQSHAFLFAPPLGLAALHFVFIGGDRYHAAVIPVLAITAAIGTRGR